jgi:hypothetical protein
VGESAQIQLNRLLGGGRPLVLADPDDNQYCISD